MVEIDKYGRIKNRNYRGPSGQDDGGNLRPLSGLRHTRSYRRGLWAQYDDFISDIGHWFADNGETMAVYLSFALLAIVAIYFAVCVVRTWLAGHPFSAIVSAVIGGIIAYHVFLIAAVIINLFIQAIFFVFRWIFKNAAWFTATVVVSIGIYYVSTHEYVLATIFEFAQSLGLYPKSHLR